ncbi:hypothetical protein HMPREF2692_06835 [Corynebacterium sp. HMSC036D03]|nr:hypothetical protein HMPREF2692_06835 [Corynebacterium sp. HMSC036D03]
MPIPLITVSWLATCTPYIGRVGTGRDGYGTGHFGDSLKCPLGRHSGDSPGDILAIALVIEFLAARFAFLFAPNCALFLTLFATRLVVKP